MFEDHTQPTWPVAVNICVRGKVVRTWTGRDVEPGGDEDRELGALRSAVSG